MIAIVAAVPFEISLLLKQLRDQTPALNMGPACLAGELAGQQTTLLYCGIGTTCTSAALTRLLERQQVQAVMMCGCGGSYSASQLQVGDLALADEEIFGDLGVATNDGFLPLEELDLPDDPEGNRLFRQRIQISSNFQNAAAELLAGFADKRSIRLACGPFVTVSTCSGHAGLSAEIESRSGGICENMEGAAAAQVCQEYQVPFLELRGISNPTGTRDEAKWDLKSGAEVAQQGILHLLENWQQLGGLLCST